MTREPDAPARRRADAYFTASFAVARRLAEGRGEEAVAILRKELERTRERGDDITGRRFLLSQIALCHARMNEPEKAAEVLGEIERDFPPEPETALMLAEGYLLLAGNAGRASHHAALALQWCQERDEGSPVFYSRAHALLARAMLADGDRLGAFGAWQSCELPDWRVAMDLLEAGHDPAQVRGVLAESLERHERHEREAGAEAVATSDRIRRLIAWIDAGRPAGEPRSV
ncbi:MAG: hypothetical protein Q9Q13_07300 [Acidobacteriota bacterium]|nr:hypothetical protein [Acidobacteriota bacterium]